MEAVLIGLGMSLVKALGGDKEALLHIKKISCENPELFKHTQEVFAAIYAGSKSSSVDVGVENIRQSLKFSSFDDEKQRVLGALDRILKRSVNKEQKKIIQTLQKQYISQSMKGQAVS
ncbi:hypothetical protein BKH46_08000 [Helicobacter sp. 12S02634-8]|uniref:hypothetical protein n=1 Tax=Helicobacter sp. 12S02634-8 TaxID=1476199 RepID=UPI000BA6FD98|nr:hypothetical protein [Helicobacter sp. 12S02634-8]PAF46319.1 hypothetical protein BKH46_08000 [Helicobacter sp. 12S02634-8]